MPRYFLTEFEGHPPKPKPKPPPPDPPPIPKPGTTEEPVIVFEIVTTGQVAPCVATCLPKQLRETKEVGQPPFHGGCKCYTEIVTSIPGR